MKTNENMSIMKSQSMTFFQIFVFLIQLIRTLLQNSMFSKIKSIFNPSSNTNSQNNGQPSFNHPQTNDSDISQCPFMNKNKNTNSIQNPENINSKNKKKENESDTSEDEQEKPKGGCPFMVSSGTKKNPNLGIDHVGFNQPFVSKFKYYLSGNKINFEDIKKGKKPQSITRDKFNCFPIYLQHTLFFTGEDFKKVRTFECCSRFLAYEELREKGNKHFNKGRFLKALDYYQRAMSLFRWLEHREGLINMKSSENLIDQSISQSEISQEESSPSKIQINLKQQQSERQDRKSAVQSEIDDFQEKYKQFFIVYHDGNVELFNGEQMTETVDLDMRKSLLIQIYLNMAAAYIKLNHFNLAEMVLKDACELSGKVSQIFLRKAQVILCNKSAIIPEIQQAMKSIEKAIQMQPNQKIFQNTNQNILKMVNIHDAKQVYAEVFKKLQLKLEEKKKEKEQIKNSIEKRLKQINKIEKQMISEGKTPIESKSYSLLSQGTDYKILNRIYSKYVRIMEFYTEAKDKSQLELGQKQFQEVLRVISQINNVQSVQIDFSNPEFGQDSEKIANRAKNIKKRKCQQIYNTAHYNFHVLEWAIKQVVNQEHEIQQKKKKQEQERLKNEKGEEVVPQKSNWQSKLPYAMIIVPVIGFALHYLI